MNTKTRIASAAGASLIVVAGAGSAFAATSTSQPTAPAKSAPVASQSSQANPAQAKLDALVKAGTITSAQEKAILTAMESHPAGKGDFSGHGPRMGGHARGGAMLKDAATAIGVSPASLEASLKSGKSIEQVAAAKGISESMLISKIQASQSPTLKTFLEQTHSSTDHKNIGTPVSQNG